MNTPICSRQSVGARASDAIVWTAMTGMIISVGHTWNRACFNGSWWTLDVTNDGANVDKKFGFQTCNSLYDADEDYVIDLIY